MIASDLDGTIIGHDGTISPRTVAAFEAARASGIHIVFVTGRPFRWLAPLSAAFGHLGTVICSNGAVVYDLEAERLIEAKTLPAASLKEVRDIVLELEPDARKPRAESIWNLVSWIPPSGAGSRSRRRGCPTWACWSPREW